MRGGGGEKRGRRKGIVEAGVEGGVNVSYNNKFCACMYTLGDYTLMSLGWRNRRKRNKRRWW